MHIHGIPHLTRFLHHRLDFFRRITEYHFFITCVRCLIHRCLLFRGGFRDALHPLEQVGIRVQLHSLIRDILRWLDEAPRGVTLRIPDYSGWSHLQGEWRYYKRRDGRWQRLGYWSWDLNQWEECA